jgi:hypothetical protein
MISALSNLLGGPTLVSHPASAKAWAKILITKPACLIRAICEPFLTSASMAQGRRWILGLSHFEGTSNLIHQLAGSWGTFSSLTKACSARRNSPGVRSTETMNGGSPAQRLLRSLSDRLAGFLGRFTVLKSGEAMGKFYTETKSSSNPAVSGVEKGEAEDPMPKNSSPMPPLPLSPEATLIRHDLMESSSILQEVVPPSWGAGADLVQGAIALAKLIGEERRGDKAVPSKTKIISPGGRMDPIAEARQHPKTPFTPPLPASAPKRKHTKKVPTEAPKALPEPKPRSRKR